MDALALVVALVALMLAVRQRRDLDDLRRTLDRAEGVVSPPAATISIPDSSGVAPALPEVPLTKVPVPGPSTFERRIGERLLLYAGMLVLVLGIAFFLRYSFDRDWMSPPVRVGIGALGGGVLLAAGRTFVRRGFSQYGLFLSGGGLAVLFLAVYASFGFYGLIGPLAAFVLLAAIASMTAVLADRDESLPLALMAVSGGFATPFLVGGREDAHVALFSYVAVLIAATMYLARRRQWPWLNLVSLAFTALTVAAWAGEHYTGSRAQAFRTELFLTLYCVMFVVILRANARSTDPHARLVTRVLWCAPAVYHAASIAILQAHGVALPVYLILASAAVVVASLEAESPALRFLGWLWMLLPLVGWMVAHQERSWLATSVVSAIGLWLISLLVQVQLARVGAVFRGWDVAHLHANGVGAYASLHLALADFVPSPVLAAVAAGLGSVKTGLWAWLGETAPQSLHWLGVASALAVVAVGVGLDGHWTVAMWGTEAAALVWLGVRFDRLWFRRAGLALYFVAAWRWLETAPPPEGTFVVFLHAKALAGALLIALLYLGAWRLAGATSSSEADVSLDRAVMLIAASVFTVLLVSLEIDSFFATAPGGGLDRELSRQLLLSASWAAYAGLTVAAGMRYRYPPIRYFAIALFGITLVKVFLIDIQRLAGIYRVTAFLVVGGILLLASFLYQRARTADR